METLEQWERMSITCPLVPARLPSASEADGPCMAGGFEKQSADFADYRRLSDDFCEGCEEGRGDALRSADPPATARHKGAGFADYTDYFNRICLSRPIIPYAPRF